MRNETWEPVGCSAARSVHGLVKHVTGNVTKTTIYMDFLVAFPWRFPRVRVRFAPAVASVHPYFVIMINVALHFTVWTFPCYLCYWWKGMSLTNHPFVTNRLIPAKLPSFTFREPHRSRQCDWSDPEGTWQSMCRRHLGTEVLSQSTKVQLGFSQCKGTLDIIVTCNVAYYLLDNALYLHIKMYWLVSMCIL